MFKNDENRKQYADVEKWKQIILFGAMLTIFISCIGLFGLSVLSAEKRTKEIGIRKVLGASVNSIVTILSTDFIKLVFICVGYCIAACVDRSKQVVAELSLSHYTLAGGCLHSAGILVILIALITISFQSIKAAIANPVKSLRTE